MGKHSLAETGEHLQREEGNLGLLTVLAHRAAHLSADAGSRVKLLSSPGFPLPGTEDPPQEDRQTDRQAHLPTPRYHRRPSSCSTPKLFKASKAAQPRHSRCSRFLLCLRLPPRPSSPAKKAGETPRPCCPRSSSPALPSAKAGRSTRAHTSVLGFLVRKAPADGKPSPAQPETAPFQHGQTVTACRTWDMSQLRRTSVRLDTQELIAWPTVWRGAGNSRGMPAQPGTRSWGKKGQANQHGKIGTARRQQLSTWPGEMG